VRLGPHKLLSSQISIREYRISMHSGTDHFR